MQIPESLEQILTVVLFAGLIYSLVFTRRSAALAFSVSAATCYLLGLVNTDEVLEKIGNPGLMTLVLLLLVSAGVEKSSWLKGLSGKLIGVGYRRSLLRMGVVTSLSSAITNNTAVVATLANAVRSNQFHPASRLLMPLSYMAVLGGTMTLIGTSTNLIVSSFLEDATDQGLAFFDFLPVGLAATVVGLVVIVLTGKHLLPAHKTRDITPHDYLIEAEVDADSPLVGKTVQENELRDLGALFLVEIVRGSHLVTPVTPREVIEAGDRLIFTGDIARLDILENFEGLSLFALEEGLLRQNLTEVIVMPGANVEGWTLKQTGFRSRFNAAVVGLHREGRQLSGKLGDIALQAGDRLMLAAGPDFADRADLDNDFIVVQDGVKSLSTAQSYLVSGALAAVIVLAALHIIPLLQGLAAMLVGMVVLGIVTPGELRRRFPFDLWLIIAAALIWSQVLNNSGLVHIVTGGLHSGLASLGPYAAIAGIFLMTLLLTEIMTNNAAAALMFPIAFALSQSYQLDYMPFIMAVAYGASASFLTPYGYTTNLMVQNLGDYELRDYLRAGLPVSIAYSATVIFLLPVVFPF